jgi:hypothetical protein
MFLRYETVMSPWAEPLSGLKILSPDEFISKTNNITIGEQSVGRWAVVMRRIATW